MTNYSKEAVDKAIKTSKQPITIALFKPYDGAFGHTYPFGKVLYGYSPFHTCCLYVYSQCLQCTIRAE